MHWFHLWACLGGGRGGRRAGGGPGRQGGEDGGAAETVWEGGTESSALEIHLLTTGVRGGAREAGKGGEMGGAREQQRLHSGSSSRAEGSEVERVDKMWQPLKTYGRVGGPGLEKGERRVWGHQDTRDVGAERQIKKNKCGEMVREPREPAGRRPQGSADIRILENTIETAIVYWGYIGIMEKKMKTTVVYWGYIGIMEKKMATTIVYLGYIGIMEKWKLL